MKLAILLLAVPLGACALPLGSAPQASPETVAACNTRADEVFLQQNRGAIYKEDTYTSSVRDSPYAGAGLPGPNSSQDLSDQYARDRTVQSCVNGTTSSTTEGASPGHAAPLTPPVEDHP